MRVVLDTNVLVSALLVESSLPAKLVTHWRQGRFTLITAVPQLEELARVTRYPKIRARLKPALAGRLVNDLREVAVMVEALPLIDASPDPYDNYLLSIASGGEADYLVTGDKPDLLALGHYGRTRIVSVRDFITLAKFLQ
ncbi:putative toxin-antitoxin system toxin component, PIN family [Methylomagnum ishizawai]|uniref:putative toxin-antitoxin system toxin component, PIN family n=1 Tax=Methylomagnum ishizawai TaxID=1760988 RepID=UPI001C333821|nr:putative toxin-antitoxin system toxin component, PIN family [Methylomagnum ishizawai]BBL77552.1 twitching motility protein PilT [Methylomagnum ishizawai]